MAKRSFLTDTTFTVLFALTMFLFAQINEPPIAVLDFNAEGITNAEAKKLTEHLRNELHNTGKYKVLEHGRMAQLFRKQGSTQTRGVSSNEMMETTQLLGVKNIVSGTIRKSGNTYHISTCIIHMGSTDITGIIDRKTTCTPGGLPVTEMKKIALLVAGEYQP